MREERGKAAVGAKRMFLFWTASPGLFGWLTRRITGGPWQHMGVGFEISDGRRVYYEALFGEGVVGPKSFDKLIDFSARHPKNQVTLKWTDLSPESCEIVRAHCDRDVTEQRGYNKAQLLTMWLLERVGIGLGFAVRDDSARVVCSEASARWLHPFYDLRDEVRTSFDSVNPNSAWRRWLEIEEGIRRRNLEATIIASHYNARREHEA